MGIGIKHCIETWQVSTESKQLENEKTHTKYELIFFRHFSRTIVVFSIQWIHSCVERCCMLYVVRNTYWSNGNGVFTSFELPAFQVWPLYYPYCINMGLFCLFFIHLFVTIAIRMKTGFNCWNKYRNKNHKNANYVL